MGTRRKPRSQSRKRLRLMAAAIAALALVAAIAMAFAARQFRSSDTMAPNVSIAGVKVGGLSASQAERAVLEAWVAHLPTKVALKHDEGVVRPSRAELGSRLRLQEAIKTALRVGREGGIIALIIQHVKLRGGGVDVAVKADVDRALLSAYLAGLAGTVERAPRNADIRVVGDRVEVVPGREGRSLDLAATLTKLERALTDPALAAAAIAIRSQQPAIRAEDLAHLEVVLARYTTHYRAWQTDRTHNLRLALGSLSRAVLMPGDTLSLNDRIGPRLAERGFRAAPIFVNGEVEPSTGGGVCQVATTVYNAALLAGLDVTERHHHSRPVDYAPSGRDATVYWGQFDLKIRNNLSRPILFLGDIDGGQMAVRILGSRGDQAEVEIARTGVRTTSYATKEIPDPNLEQGKRVVEKPGRRGAAATVSRTVTRAGHSPEVERLHSDVYSPQTQIVRVGTKPLVPPPGTPGAAPGQPGVQGPPAKTPPTTAAPRGAPKPGSAPAGGDPSGRP